MNKYSVQDINALLNALSDHPIGFRPAYAHICGNIIAGLFLSQCMYWTSKLSSDRDGWFYHSRDEWQDELCVSHEMQETARKKLRDLGFLEEKREGLPARLWFRVNCENVNEALINYGKKPPTSSRKSIQHNADIYGVQMPGIPVNNKEARARYDSSETTAETTADIQSTSYPSTSTSDKSKRFIPPTVEEAEAYCVEQGAPGHGEEFCAYWEGFGWNRNRQKMADWKASLRYWISRAKQRSKAFESRGGQRLVPDHRDGAKPGDTCTAVQAWDGAHNRDRPFEEKYAYARILEQRHKDKANALREQQAQAATALQSNPDPLDNLFAA